MGIIAGVIALSFAYWTFVGRRDVGTEVSSLVGGDGKIWWQSLRPVHMILWAAFSYGALTDHRDAWKILAADTTLGLSAFLVHHFA